MSMNLFGYFRSSASYRVRIAMNLKGLSYEAIPVHLTHGGGEQYQTKFKQVNPQSLVPFLISPDGAFGQSLAIIEYLEERYPSVPLLPSGLGERAYVRQLAGMIACDVHPLNNLRVLQYLTKEFSVSEQAKLGWISHWVSLGFAAFEETVKRSPYRGHFCFGNSPTLADCCLVPQLFNARRFNVDLSPYPILLKIEAQAQDLEAFAHAAPRRQPDAE
jgi:maleylpyruvate isomerase